MRSEGMYEVIPPRPMNLALKQVIRLGIIFDVGSGPFVIDAASNLPIVSVSLFLLLVYLLYRLKEDGRIG